MSSIIKPLFLATAEIQPHTSEYSRPHSSNTASSFSLSFRTRKFLALALPAWYLSWQLAPLLPEALKPDIDVKSLLDWDVSMFGFLPHRTLHEYFEFDVNGFPVVDFLMALPYSLHVFWPILFVAWCAKTSRWSSFISFVNCFGVLSFSAVLTELYYPTAPPWYYEKYGFAPANYGVHGDPGTLARVDSYFQGQFYYNTFSKSPLVFGAFPSLHVGWPTLLMLFFTYAHDINIGSRLKTLVYLYYAWVCFAVVYLQHHYVIDVLGGAAYALISYHLFGPHRDAVDVHSRQTAIKSI
eukprot:Phypoly_transcript_12866.p1 GENE.Phypoly_transcript_12866~~Phypoly_transcript_12866.p1  ORF type:complete len:296 (+),score=7.23 Phypoly_transcript_12866:179-1066(+)